MRIRSILMIIKKMEIIRIQHLELKIIMAAINHMVMYML